MDGQVQVGWYIYDDVLGSNLLDWLVVWVNVKVLCFLCGQFMYLERLYEQFGEFELVCGVEVLGCYVK